MTAGEKHLSESEISAYLDGELLPARRAGIAAHLEACSQCRDEVGDVARLLRGAPLPVARSARSRINRAGIGIALAAGLAAILFVRREDAPVREPVIRTAEAPATSEARPRIRVISPDDQASSSSAKPVFVWRAERATFFRFTLADAEGKPLISLETTDTVLALPASITLEPGRLYFWNVDAIANGIVASSGMQRFTVSE